ncbi:MAG: nucleotidyltransferase family protein [Novosphingobium sp.]
MLALLSDAPEAALERLAGIDGESLTALFTIANQHRVLPLLHHFHHADPRVPVELSAAGKAAYRLASIEAMALKAERDAIAGLLAQAGMAPIVLKGGWLAWSAYPDPALRPMRDLDFLLDPAHVGQAQDLLVSRGFTATPAELPLADMLALDKHLPPLTSPRGLRVELHHRLWEVEGRMDHMAPRGDAAPLVQRAVSEGGLRFLAPTDMLMHLIVHAAYDHRLDCGPLLVTDIAYLIAARPIDWPAFWRAAQANGWERGARLVLDLVARQRGIAVVFPERQVPCPAEVLNAAPDLLLQDLATRQSAGVVATARVRGLRGLIDRLAARRSSGHGDGTVARDLAGQGGFASWAKSRASRTISHLSRADVRRQSADLARLSDWLGNR